MLNILFFNKINVLKLKSFGFKRYENNGKNDKFANSIFFNLIFILNPLFKFRTYKTSNTLLSEKRNLKINPKI